MEMINIKTQQQIFLLLVLSVLRFLFKKEYKEPIFYIHLMNYSNRNDELYRERLKPPVSALWITYLFVSCSLMLRVQKSQIAVRSGG